MCFPRAARSLRTKVAGVHSNELTPKVDSLPARTVDDEVRELSWRVCLNVNIFGRAPIVFPASTRRLAVARHSACDSQVSRAIDEDSIVIETAELRSRTVNSLDDDNTARDSVPSLSGGMLSTTHQPAAREVTAHGPGCRLLPPWRCTRDFFVFWILQSRIGPLTAQGERNFVIAWAWFQEKGPASRASAGDVSCLIH